MSASTRIEAPNLTEHRTGLQRIENDGALRGFGNIYRKEIEEWFGTRRWIAHSIVWIAIIDAIIAFVYFVVPRIAEAESGAVPAELNSVEMGLSLFFSMLFQAGAVGAIVIGLDEVIKEKQTGTAAWVLSKPVTRPSFLLGKLTATGIGMLVFIVALTSIVAYGEITLAVGHTFDVLPFVVGTAIVALALFYYLTLTLMLGTLFNERGPVLGIGLGYVFGGGILLNLLSWLGLVTPLSLYKVAIALSSGAALPENWLISLLTTAAGAVIFAVVALWRFNREEF